MSTALRRVILVLVAGLTLSSCGKPKELAYSKLGYNDGVLTDPETSRPFTGIARDVYKDGKPKAEYPIKDGKFHGLVREWHPNGKLSSETEFTDGEHNGTNKEWTADGLPYIERVYDHEHIVREKTFEQKK